jgi:hypothetical protein
MHKQFSIAWILILSLLISSPLYGQSSFTPNCDPTGNWILFANQDDNQTITGHLNLLR